MTDAEKLLVCTDALSAAAGALGDIMHALTARHILATERKLTAPMRESMMKAIVDDNDLAKRAANAFEAAVVVMVKLGVPGTSMHVCTADDMEIV